jgi:uncharacterized membrane protein YGL010W
MKAWLADYLAHHRDTRNQLTHMIGIPMIVLSLFGLLWRVPVWSELSLNGADFLMVFGLLFYCVLDWRLAIPLTLVFWGLGRVGSVLSLETNAVLFTLGWILQGVGHIVYEKRSPAFTKNLIHLLVGPLWVFAKLTGFPIGVEDSDSGTRSS